MDRIHWTFVHFSCDTILQTSCTYSNLFSLVFLILLLDLIYSNECIPVGVKTQTACKLHNEAKSWHRLTVDLSYMITIEIACINCTGWEIYRRITTDHIVNGVMHFETVRGHFGLIGCGNFN